MITSFSSPKTKIPLSSNTQKEKILTANINTNKLKNYKDNSNLLSSKNQNHKINKVNIDLQKDNENINPNETLSNIIDAINENNLNAFYEDDTSNFKRNIDQLNLKFYLETEKIIKSSNNNETYFNSNKLFLILFKQINLYISEIERLNVIILDSKRDPHSISKKLAVINRQKSDFEIKQQIIKTLKFSISSLEKQLANALKSENLLRQENKKLQEEKKFYMDYYLKHSNKDNIDIKISISNNRYNNINLNNTNNKINTSNNYIFKYNTNNISNNNINTTNSYNHSYKKDDKQKKDNNNKNRNNIDSDSNNKNSNKENSLNKKNDMVILAKHRRTYSAQNEEMINSLNKKIDKISQGMIKHTNTKTNRLTKPESKNPTKIINHNINNPLRGGSGYTPVENINNKIIQSVKDGMREKYLNRKKKSIMNCNHSNANKLELILNKDTEGSFMKYKSSIYTNSPQYQTTTNGTFRDEDNLNYFNKVNNNDNSCNINYNSKNNNFNKNSDYNEFAELNYLEELITEVRDYLVNNKNKTNENNKNNKNESNNINKDINKDDKVKIKEFKDFNNNVAHSQNIIKNISFKTWSTKKE